MEPVKNLISPMVLLLRVRVTRILSPEDSRSLLKLMPLESATTDFSAVKTSSTVSSSSQPLL